MRTGMGASARGWRAVAPPLLFFAGFMAAWQLAVTMLDIPPFLLPGPLAILAAAAGNGPALLSATAVTASGALAGFALSQVVGLLIACAFAEWELARRAGYPYAIFLQTVPIVAIAPLIIIWFGPGFPSVVVVSFIISLFPVITNGTTGLTRIDPDLRDLFLLNNATRLQLLLKLKLPHAVPYLVAGARISSGLAVIGAIVGEFFAGFGSSRFGLGYLVVLTSGQLKTDYLFAAILASTLLGLAIFWLTGRLGDMLLARWGGQER
jgi:NitT/TauT family transport system permease protein